MRESHPDVSLGWNIRTALYHGLIGIAIGSVGGGLVGAAVWGLASWFKENPEEPVWIFVGTKMGLAYGVMGGLVSG